MSLRILLAVCAFFSLNWSAPLRAGAKDPDPRVAELIATLKGADAAARLKAIGALADLGPAAGPAAPHLVAVLTEKNEDVRLNSALALAKIGAAAVPEIVKALPHKDEDVRFYAVWSLGWIGPEAKTAIPLLEELAARDVNINVRNNAKTALSKIKM